MRTSNEERLEELEEVVQQTVIKVKTLEGRKVELPEIRFPDHTPLLKAIEVELQRVHHSYPVDRIEKQVDNFGKLVDRLPQRIRYEHRHYFQDSSKGFIISMIAMIMITTLSVGIALNAWIINRQLNERAIKFRMIRQYYPVAARWADKSYHKDQEAAIKDIERLEAEQEALMEDKATAAERELR